MGYSFFYCEEQIVVQRIEHLSMEYRTAAEYRSGRREYLSLRSTGIVLLAAGDFEFDH